MKQYKLVDSNYGLKLINELTEHLKVKKDDYKKFGDFDIDRCPLYYFEGAINIINKCQLRNIDKDINNFMTDDCLTFTESVLIVNGLNPYAGNAIDIDVEGIPRGGDNCSYDILFDYLYANNEGYRKLSKALESIKGFGFTSDSEYVIYTKEFIPWAINKGILTIVNEKNKKNNINKFNSERANAKEHNKQVIIDAFYKYKSRSDSIKSFMDNNKHYEKYKSDLVLMFEDGALPKKSTLRDYLYDSKKKKT